jgi:UDP-N-acetylmuramoylalanine--D-glutamate ligase
VLLELGGHRAEAFAGADLVVVSPGVPWDLPELEAARAAGVLVIAELELGFRHMPGRVAATLGAILREAGRDVRVGGNIGDAATGLLDGTGEATVFVLEVSSFQLEGTRQFRPDVAVFLNLSPDHLDRHASFEDYAGAKARIFANQTGQDWAVVNADDPGVLALARRARARILPFHPLTPSIEGAFFEGALARLRHADRAETLFSRERLQVPGAHLAGDLLAAAAAARLLGAPVAAVERAVETFAGAEHVLERVAEVGGVAFFNDSKATNVEAALKSVEAMDRPVLLIAGGRYKGGDFRDLREAMAGRGKAVFAIGESRERVREALSGAVPVTACASLEEAVARAYAAAAPGDAVLLAPGCSSFDMFRDYAERGRAFKAEVRRLAAGHVGGRRDG